MLTQSHLDEKLARLNSLVNSGVRNLRDTSDGEERSESWELVNPINSSKPSIRSFPRKVSQLGTGSDDTSSDNYLGSFDSSMCSF
jgi:hypothetical protein